MEQDELPPYWVVEKDTSNPYWEKVLHYIHELDPDKGNPWKGNHAYYGIDNRGQRYGGTMGSDRLKDFSNSPELITIDRVISFLNYRRLAELPHFQPGIYDSVTW